MVTGSAVAAYALTAVTIAMYFLGSQPPSVRTVLARVGLDVLVCLCVLLFTAGLAVLVATSGHPRAWLAVPLALVGVLWMALGTGGGLVALDRDHGQGAAASQWARIPAEE